MSDTKAQRLVLAVDEIVTDAVRFAYPGTEDSFQITFRTDLSTAEVIIQEQEVPFDPSAATYERAQAVEEGDHGPRDQPARQRLVRGHRGLAVLWGLQDDDVEVAAS